MTSMAAMCYPHDAWPLSYCFNSEAAIDDDIKNHSSCHDRGAARFPPSKTSGVEHVGKSAERSHDTLWDRPTAPSSEMSRPPLPRPTVRLRRPSGDAPRIAQGQASLPPGPGLAVYPGRECRVSIAAKGFDAEFAGAARQTQAKRYMRRQVCYSTVGRALV